MFLASLCFLWGVNVTDPFRLEARYYDKIWGAKHNYKEQARFLHQVLRKHNARRVLDLGCGTGGHCFELAKLGYNVAGLDISQLMIEKAREKLSKEGIQAKFVVGDMTNAYSTLKNAKIKQPFDAVICLGYSLAHILTDKSLKETLEQVRKVLNQDGVFIFQVRNAEQLSDDRMERLTLDTIINEPDHQLALLSYSHRDRVNRNFLVWNTLWLINDHGKTDFQARKRLLKWFQYDNLRTVLASHRFRVLHAYGDMVRREDFDRNKHNTIVMICQKELSS
ncbi:MAG: methyltransferase domain-containing protein [Candidatus Bathyarchaeota archaeon]|nr:methyltransferase domain-containing protein [Candidatus Bathyarchaeota archaeon]